MTTDDAVIAAGVDGCKGGWIAARLQGTHVSLQTLRHIREVEFLGAETVALDMPIGLPASASWAGRECDQQARALLGPRRASIFPPPTRALLAARDFAELKGSGLSLQAFNLFPKIREVDEYLTPERQESIHETHPELVFARLAGHPMVNSKKKAEGREERRACLQQHTAIPAIKPRGCTWDDVLDAIALAIAARDRIVGLGRVLPTRTIQRDARGLRMEICF